jgi:signal transduction histidine kinase
MINSIVRRRYWLRIITVNAAAAVIATAVFTRVGIHTPLRRIAETLAISFLFSMCVGPLVGVVMPRVSPLLWSRLRFPFNWVAAAAIMIVLAAAGSVVAIGVLVAIGYVPIEQVGEWFAGAVRVAIAVTLIIGLFVTANEVNKARLAQVMAEAQLAALESKVQPHFLFNTLNSIAELIRQDPAAAERMTERLASLLRSTLAQESTALVRLEDELRLVRDYLEIERVRFGDRLRYAIDTDPAVADTALVPRLALQTLVENSIKYAVSPRREGGSLRIRVTGTDGRVCVEVHDDGPGFDAASLPAGHGLASLRERLSIVFGHTAALRIVSTSAGTAVTMTLPAARADGAVVARKGPAGWAYQRRLRADAARRT